jgi:hypothetical protein
MVTPQNTRPEGCYHSAQQRSRFTAVAHGQETDEAARLTFEISRATENNKGGHTSGNPRGCRAREQVRDRRSRLAPDVRTRHGDGNRWQHIDHPIRRQRREGNHRRLCQPPQAVAPGDERTPGQEETCPRRSRGRQPPTNWNRCLRPTRSGDSRSARGESQGGWPNHDRKNRRLDVNNATFAARHERQRPLQPGSFSCRNRRLRNYQQMLRRSSQRSLRSSVCTSHERSTSALRQGSSQSVRCVSRQCA